MSVHLSVDACYHPSHRPLHVRFQPGDSQSEVLNKPASLAPQHPAIARLGSNQRSPRLHKGSRECTPKSLARGRSRTPSAQATASYSVSAYQIVYRCRLNTIIQWWPEAEIHKKSQISVVNQPTWEITLARLLQTDAWRTVATWQDESHKERDCRPQKGGGRYKRWFIRYSYCSHHIC
jgi:hypothetical protein